ncbi:ribosomal-protein-alanine N-acetyltransferase [Pseudoxanthomonas sp. GM95]|uniref:GNAT family N-acetyltransferase n=1 Tax=Pseudoxanthomonas sp. GM95 TaxID=1881043 RepID=UPI0008AD30A0|nr:GNAT family protein [Pseudoxanthomonas sp. GM95]SEK78446.1 ribosomal-protein-alanine N-acetyltransferase [Pseudoxanthomonas sp. GM95]
MGDADASVRVDVRPLRREDAAALIVAHQASVALHRPWVSPCLDPAGFEAWFARTHAADYVSLIAFERGSGQVAGVFNASQISRGNFLNACLGYYACQPCAGHGLMRAALPQVLAHLFGVVGLHRIEANIQPDNAPSIALARGAGFRLEGYSPRYLKINGQWRDHERWALLADEVGFSATP